LLWEIRGVDTILEKCGAISDPVTNCAVTDHGKGNWPAGARAGGTFFGIDQVNVVKARGVGGIFLQSDDGSGV